MPDVALPHPARDAIALGDVLFALSDAERLDLVRQLRGGPVDAQDCVVGDASMPKSTKSHLMKVLREAGVIRNDPSGRGRGRGRVLTLRRDDLDARFPGLLDAVLDAPSD